MVAESNVPDKRAGVSLLPFLLDPDMIGETDAEAQKRHPPVQGRAMGRLFSRRRRADFAQVYREHVTRVYRYVYARVGNKEDAEDLTAQVFFEAWEKWPSYREEGKVAAWLFTIARRRVADYHRHKRSTVSLEALPPVDDPVGPWDTLEREEALAHLAYLVSRLGEEEQELLRLRFAAGLTYREMAEVLGRSEAAVKMAVHRLLRRLARMWEATYEGA